MVLNELWGEKMVIYHVKFSKEMLIRIHTHTPKTHSLQFSHTHFSSSSVAVATTLFPG